MDNNDQKIKQNCNCNDAHDCKCGSVNYQCDDNCCCVDCQKPNVGKVASNSENNHKDNNHSSGKQKVDAVQLQKNLDEVVLIAQKLRFENEKIATQLKKALADYANMQRDNDKRNEIVIKQLKAKSAMEIISVLDEIELAYQAKEKLQIDQAVSAWLDGMVATMRKLNRSLETLGVAAMGCKNGDVFDSLRHEALGVVYEGKEGHIAQVMQDGYIITGTDLIVRPARVIVSKNK